MKDKAKAQWWYIWADRPDPESFPNMLRTFEELRRGPFMTKEEAEGERYRDQLEGYWQYGLAVYADHCVACGKWAKVLAFDNTAGGWAWRVTECKYCGMVDSRTYTGDDPNQMTLDDLEE